MFRDDRNVMRWYGLCPDCGYPGSNCLCRRNWRLDDQLNLVESEERQDNAPECDDNIPF